MGKEERLRADRNIWTGTMCSPGPLSPDSLTPWRSVVATMGPLHSDRCYVLSPFGQAPCYPSDEAETSVAVF